MPGKKLSCNNLQYYWINGVFFFFFLPVTWLNCTRPTQWCIRRLAHNRTNENRKRSKAGAFERRSLVTGTTQPLCCPFCLQLRDSAAYCCWTEVLHLSLANCWFCRRIDGAGVLRRSFLLNLLLNWVTSVLLLTRASVLFVPQVRVLQFTSHPRWEIPHLNKICVWLSQLPLGGLAPDPLSRCWIVLVLLE